MSLAECLVVFEIDIDGTSGGTDSRSVKGVGGIEYSGEGVEFLPVQVEEVTEI